MPVLLPKNHHKPARLRVTIPASLLAEIEEVRCAAEARGLTLDVNLVCSDALARAVRQARAELEQIGGQSGGQNAA